VDEFSEDALGEYISQNYGFMGSFRDEYAMAVGKLILAANNLEQILDLFILIEIGAVNAAQFAEFFLNNLNLGPKRQLAHKLNATRMSEGGPDYFGPDQPIGKALQMRNLVAHGRLSHAKATERRVTLYRPKMGEEEEVPIDEIVEHTEALIRHSDLIWEEAIVPWIREQTVGER
jgi:hypothetical protein